MSAMSKKVLLSAVAAALAGGCSRTWAGVTVLQNGVSPKADYAGCKDTWVGNGPWGETRRNNGAAAVLQGARGKGKKPRIRNILMRFDLSPIPKGDKVHRAVLRLADASYPRRDRDGKFKTALVAYVLTREWKADANWSEHTRTDPRKVDEGDWKTPGGEYDTKTDFGLAKGGVVGTDAVCDGAFGHAHELDVTEAVRRWHAGKLPNHGFLLTGGGTVASSDWPVPAYRPKLIIDHGGKPSGIPALKPVGKGVALDPAAKTPDPNKPTGDHAVVRVGQNANCAVRGASASAYVKENVAGYPGPWGWMTHCRVGGVAGDVSRALLYFDLSELPKTASIKSAKLVCSLVRRSSGQVRSYRNGVFLVRLGESPGWSAAEATASERAAGAPWPGGGVALCSGPAPLSLGTVTQKEIVHRKRKQRVDAGIEFDVTGAVRAWVAKKVPNCGVVLDNRIEGGAYDIYGSRAWDPTLRPYLEIEVSPAIARKPAPIKVQPKTPTGDYWVEAMRQVHKRFKGTPGTLAQYGDSITITDAFLSSYAYARKIEPKKCTPEVKKECQVVEKYADLSLWRKWKGIGNTGCTTSDWLSGGVARWQKKLNPEAAVIMFGTNDGMSAPQYAENIASSLRRMMADGTVPLLSSPPPKSGGDKSPYWRACIAIAEGLKVPLIDFYAEILRRRPDDWDGQLPQFKKYKGYQQPTLMHDAHPSNCGQYVNDFSEEGLNKNGYNLRNYMTIRMYSQVISKAFQAGEK